MKIELIKKITSCCRLPYKEMLTWLDSLIYPNDVDGSVKNYVKSQLMSNGELRNNGWLMLLENAEFEWNAPINSSTAVQWLKERTTPNCDQLKVIITSLKLMSNFPIVVEGNILDQIEVDFRLKPRKVSGRSFSTFLGRKNSAVYIEGFTHIPTFVFKNFDLIKNFEPYLVIERLVQRHNRDGSGKSKRWVRDRTMCVIDGNFRNGWDNTDHQISYENGYRPNNIPIVQPVQDIDLYLENYFLLNSGHGVRRGIIGSTYKDNYLQQPNGENELLVRKYQKQKIHLRIRLAFRLPFGNHEKISKPLRYFTIFAIKGVQKGLFNNEGLYFSLSK